GADEITQLTRRAPDRRGGPARRRRHRERAARDDRGHERARAASASAAAARRRSAADRHLHGHVQPGHRALRGPGGIDPGPDRARLGLRDQRRLLGAGAVRARRRGRRRRRAVRALARRAAPGLLPQLRARDRHGPPGGRADRAQRPGRSLVPGEARGAARGDRAGAARLQRSEARGRGRAGEGREPLGGPPPKPRQPGVARDLEHGRRGRVHVPPAGGRLRPALPGRAGLELPRPLARGGGALARRDRLHGPAAPGLRPAPGRRPRARGRGPRRRRAGRARARGPHRAVARVPRPLAVRLLPDLPPARLPRPAPPRPLRERAHPAQAARAAADRGRRALAAGARVAGDQARAGALRPQRDAAPRDDDGPRDPVAAPRRAGGAWPDAPAVAGGRREPAFAGGPAGRLAAASVAGAKLMDRLPLPEPDAAGVESRVIWLFGSPRSGSTWLLRMAVQHPRIFGMNEPTIGYHLSPFLANEPGYHPDDLDLATFTLRRVVAGDPERFFAEKYADVWLPALRRMLNERLAAHLEREFGGAAARDGLLLVKEPNGSQSADVI